jgi:hypothetical protein
MAHGKPLAAIAKIQVTYLSQKKGELIDTVLLRVSSYGYKVSYPFKFIFVQA